MDLSPNACLINNNYTCFLPSRKLFPVTDYISFDAPLKVEGLAVVTVLTVTVVTVLTVPTVTVVTVVTIVTVVIEVK